MVAEAVEANFPKAQAPVIKPRDREDLENMMGVEQLPPEILPVWEKWMRRYHRCKPGTMSIPLEAKLAFVHAVEMMGLLDFTEIDKARKLGHAEINRLHYNALILVAPEPGKGSQKPQLARFRGTEGNKVLLHFVKRDAKGHELLEKEQKGISYDRIHFAQDI